MAETPFSRLKLPTWHSRISITAISFSRPSNTFEISYLVPSWDMEISCVKWSVPCSAVRFKALARTHTRLHPTITAALAVGSGPADSISPLVDVARVRSVRAHVRDGGSLVIREDGVLRELVIAVRLALSIERVPTVLVEVVLQEPVPTGAPRVGSRRPVVPLVGAEAVAGTITLRDSGRGRVNGVDSNVGPSRLALSVNADDVASISEVGELNGLSQG